MSSFEARKRPNILITGTPGTGKTTTAESIAELTDLKHFNVGEFVKAHACHEGYDEEFDTYVNLLPPTEATIHLIHLVPIS